MECLFAPFVCARVLLFRLMAELVSSAVFGSGKNLYGGDQRDDFICDIPKVLTFGHPGRWQACTLLPFIALLTRWEFAWGGEEAFTGELGRIPVWLALLQLVRVDGVAVVHRRLSGGIRGSEYVVLNADML